MGNLAWTTLLIVAVVLLPGIVAVHTYRKHGRGSWDLEGRAIVVAAVLAASLCHVLLFASLYVCPFLPNPSAPLIWGTFDGRVSDEQLSALEDQRGWIGSYLGASALLGALVGLVTSWIASRKSDMTVIENSLYAGGKGLFVVADVLTKDGLLYRGLYHSRVPKDCKMEHLKYFNLVLASRWVDRRKLLPLSKVDQRAEAIPSEPVLEEDEDLVQGFFTDIASFVTVEELTDMVYPELVETYGEEGQAEEIAELFRRDEDVRHDYLWFKVREEPDLSIPVGEIKNVNLRTFHVAEMISAEGAGAQDPGAPEGH